MITYEPLAVGSFMRRSASASSTSSLASDQVSPPMHKMESGTKLQSRGVYSLSAPHKTQLPPRVHYPGHLSASSWRGACQRNVWLVVGVLVFCSVSLYAFSLTRGIQSRSLLRKASNGFGIVIDAGSSGSRLHVYKYSYYGQIPEVDHKYSVSKKVTPGLSSFAEAEPDSAGESLSELLNFAKQNIPEKEWATTRVYLMATAGLRLVELAIQERILDSCRESLRESPFLFEDVWASVISGIDEGKFAWVSANYVLGTLGHDASETYGIVELGGASAQVTFVPDVLPPKEYLETIELGGVIYKLYTHSFLKLGQEAAFQALLQLLCSGAIQSLPAVEDGVVVDPCTPKGYEGHVEDVVAHSSVCAVSAPHLAVLPGQENIPISTILSAGNFSECRRVALSLLQQGKESCRHTPCAIGSSFIPNLKGKFFGTENFFYTSQFFGLPANATLRDIEAAGEHYCEQDWSALQNQHSHISKEDLLKYCFSASYIIALLHDSLGIAMQEDRITFTNEVGEVPLDWALGAFIVGMGEDSSQRQSLWLVGDEVFTILSMMASFVTVGFVLWFIVRWRRPHLKTIYDLEKGRYITTPARSHR